MEHYALTLQCSPILSPLSYGSKPYENRKFHLRFNQTTHCFPRVTASHNVARSISHANCMNNSFSVPKSKTIEKPDNSILRGINGVSIVLGCILGMFNFNSQMMNSKFNTAYARINPNLQLSGGASSFDSLWNSMNAELIESEIKFNAPATPDNRKKQALFLRKIHNNKEVENKLKKKKDEEIVKDLEDKLEELRADYLKSSRAYSSIYIGRSVRLSFMEVLLIQEQFAEAQQHLDKEIDSLIKSKSFPTDKIFQTDKSSKMLDVYNEQETDHDKQGIADIIFYKAIVHTMLKDTKEAAKWWDKFAKTL